MPFPIIDLFAGPGGLGEGFSSHLTDSGERVFKIALSVEKDAHAHRTLELRAFTREFPVGDIPPDYYQFLEGKITRHELFRRHKNAAERASREAWKTELGDDTPNSTIDLRIKAAIGNRVRWVLIGGPPCQAYSLVGRSRIIGEKGRDAYDADHRHELYRHYLRILAVHRPPVFVMENVKGLLSAKVKEERIPKTSFFAGGFINFRHIHTLKETNASEAGVQIIAQLSPPFVKDMVSRFSSYYARQGQPDLRHPIAQPLTF